MKKLSCFSDDHWVVIRGIADKLNEAIDLVNSQQEAIEKLAERLELTERRARYACLHALKRENEELADDKPVSCRKCMTNTHIELCCPKSYTHRTVTLRIPKEKTLGEALWDAFDQENQNPDISMGEWLLDRPDTDLQKALDKLKGESNE